MLYRYIFSLSICFGLAAPLLAQDSPLEFFGGDVDVLIRLAEPDATTDHLVALINGVQPGFGEIARGAMNENLGRAISNPTLTGVDLSRDWHVGIYSKGNEEPQVVFAIPAVEPEDVVGAIGDGFDSKISGKYVLFTDKGELPETPETSASLASKLSEGSQETLKTGQLSLYVNAAHLTNVYEVELDTAYDQVLEGLNQLRFLMPQDQGINMGAIIDMYGTIAEKFFQGVRDADSLTVAVTAGEKGLQIEEFLEFADGSKSSQQLTHYPNSALAELNNLPNDAVMYYGVSGGLSDMVKWSMGFSASMVQDEEMKEKVEKAFENFDKIKFGSMVGNLSIGNSSNGLIQAVSIIQATPVSEMRDYLIASIDAMGTLELPGVTQTTTVDQEAETYGDLKADIISVKQEIDENLPQAEMQKKFQEILFGENGIQSRVVYMSDQYVTIMGGGQDGAKLVIENLASPAGAGLEESRKILMDELVLISLLDLPNAVGNALAAASEIDEIPLPIDAQMIGNLNLKPSFIGFGIATEKNSVRCRTDIPMDQIQGIYKIGMMFVGLQNQL